MRADQTRLAKLLGSRGMRLSDLARDLRVNKTTVSRWALKEVPIDRLLTVSAKTGIPVHEIRPDLASVFVPSRGTAA